MFALHLKPDKLDLSKGGQSCSLNGLSCPLAVKNGMTGYYRQRETQKRAFVCSLAHLYP